MGTAIYKLSGKINFQVKKTHIAEGKYMCHSHCRDLVHLDYPQNGRLPSCRPTCEVRHSSEKNSQVGSIWCLQSSEFQAVPSLVPVEQSLGPGSYLCICTGSSLCSIFATTPFLGAHCFGSFGMGCDFSNSTIECIDKFYPTDCHKTNKRWDFNLANYLNI